VTRELSLRNVGLAILGLGILLALLSDKAAVTIALLTLGLGAYALGELIPRLEGSFKLGPGGFAGTLASARPVESTTQPTVQIKQLPSLTVPKMQIRSKAKLADVAWPNTRIAPATLQEGDALNLTVDYKTPSGERFQVVLPVEFKEIQDG
jgi:hypothetical protein